MSRQIAVLVCALCALISLVATRPDSAGQPPLPGPGLAYGGIPYGSMSGNVAEYFRRQAHPGGRSRDIAGLDVDYAPIEQWL